MVDNINHTKLGFGCAPVMGRIGERQALRAMAIAVDHGVTHFDIARSYGFGHAENVLGKFISARERSNLTITSKFGIIAPNISIYKRNLAPIARIMSKIAPGIKGPLKKHSSKLLIERNFNAVYAQNCLEKSLRELKTDYIDFYLLHEPDVNSIVDYDELYRVMEDSKRYGKIKKWGIAYKNPSDHVWADYLDSDIIQFEGNIQTARMCSSLAEEAIRKRIITRPFAGGILESSFLGFELERLQLQDAVKSINASVIDVSLSLASHLSGKSGTVVTSMFTEKHISNNVQSLINFSNNKVMAYVIKMLLQDAEIGLI